MFRVLTLLSITLFFGGCAGSDPEGATLAVENMRLVQQPHGGQAVSGVVRNTGDRMQSAQLEITLFGDRNERIGLVHVPVERIEAGRAKGFDWSLDVDAQGARLRRILAF